MASGSYTPAQVNVAATVNPFGNLYVNTGILSQANATTSIKPVANVYVNAVPVQANTTATASSLIGYGLSEANCSVTVASVFGNVQVTVPITNATASGTSLIGYGISQANASISVRATTPQVNVTAPTVLATTSAASIIALGISQANTTVSVTSVTPQVSSNAIHVIATTGLGSLTPNIQINAVSVVVTTGLGSLTPNVQAKPVQALATTGFGSVFGNVQVTASITNATGTALGAAYEYGISQANATVTINPVTTVAGKTVFPDITSATATAQPPSSYQISGNTSVTQALATTGFGSVYANIQITPPQALATTGYGVLSGNVQVTSPITNATASVRSLIAFGISQASATVSTGVVSSNLQVTPAITNATAIVETISMQGVPPAPITAGVGTLIPRNFHDNSSGVGFGFDYITKYFYLRSGVFRECFRDGCGYFSGCPTYSRDNFGDYFTEAAVPKVSVVATQASATTIAEQVATRVPGRGNVTQASCSAETGQVYSKVLTNVLSASASTTARSPSRSIFVQAI